MDTVMVWNLMPSTVKRFSVTSRQMRSATVTAPPKWVLGSTTRNSSPP